MKNTNFTITMLMAFALLFSACSDILPDKDDDPVEVNDDNNDNNDDNTILEPIVVNAGESEVCTSATSFTATPTNDPIVTFTTDAVSGATTIDVNVTSTGYVTLSNCTTTE